MGREALSGADLEREVADVVRTGRLVWDSWADDAVVRATYEPLAAIDLSGGSEGVALGEAINVLARGATLMHPSHEIEDTPWGDRVIQFFDPMGHVWQIMTNLEDVAEEDLPAREAQRDQMRKARQAAAATS